MGATKTSKKVGNPADVGATIVVECIEQVMKQAGSSAAVECAAGALSAAISTLVVSLDEADARSIIANAVEGAVQCLATEVKRSTH